MKRIGLSIIVAVLFTANAKAESVYDFLKKEYEYSRISNTLNIYAHNAHSSKRINVTKVEVMFSPCGGLNWDNPDRVYSINRTIAPQSDRHLAVDARFPSSAKKRCMRLWAEFVTPRKIENNNKAIDNLFKSKEQKSGSQKLLDKIIGR